MNSMHIKVLSNNITHINWNNLANDETKPELLIPKNPDPEYKLNWSPLSSK